MNDHLALQTSKRLSDSISYPQEFQVARLECTAGFWDQSFWGSGPAG